MIEKKNVVKWMKDYLVETFNDYPADPLVNCFGIGEVDTSMLAEDYVFDSDQLTGTDSEKYRILEDEEHPDYFPVYEGCIDAAEWFEKNYSRRES